MAKPIIYTVWYKKPGWWFWRKIKNVMWDGAWWAAPEVGNGMRSLQTLPLRVFYLIDDSRIELPSDMMFKYDEKRKQSIDADVSSITGK
jgi:hypothetical protein